MEDPTKVQAKLSELNRGLNPAQWVAGHGFHSLTTFTFNLSAPPTFNPAEGLPVKVFFNTVSGEYRLFAGVFFLL